MQLDFNGPASRKRNGVGYLGNLEFKMQTVIEYAIEVRRRRPGAERQIQRIVQE